MKRVKLVYVKGAEIGTRKNQGYPLGLITIKQFALVDLSIYNNVDIDIHVLDYEVHDEAFVYEIYLGKYDMVLFSSFIWNVNRNLEICRKIKLVCKNVIVGLGGPEIDNGLEIMKENEFIDLILIGEGEITFKNIIKLFLLKNKDIKLSGVFYRNKSEIVSTGIGELIHNLDDIPTVINDDLVKQSGLVLYETSRGCPFQCKYCCWANKKMRYYSLERVEYELKELLKRPEGDQVFIIDSELDIDMVRAKEIMSFLIKYNIHNKTIQGFLGLHNLDEELLNLCKKADFKFGIGIQTTSAQGLNDCGRTWFDIHKFEQKVPIIKKYYDFKDIEFQLIMGLPGDNYETFRNNLRWCDKLGATNITANRLYVLPGSYFYKHSEKYNLVFDKKPYHLVYSNYTYSYGDLMKSEALLVAFQVTKDVFRGIDILSSNNASLHFWDFIDSFVNIIQDKKMYSQGRQESQITEKNYDFQEAMLENLSLIHCNYEEFSDFIKMRFAKLRANYYYGQIKNHEGKEGIYRTVKIKEYFLAPFVNIVNDYIYDAGNQYILYLYNYTTHKIKTIKIDNRVVKSVAKRLEELKNGISLNFIKDISNDSQDLKLIKILIDKNLVYYE